MRTFWLGFIIAIGFGLLAGLLFVRLGFVNPRADIPVNRLERSIAMPSLDAAVGRRAPQVANPLQPSEANLLAGMTIYQAHCAVCHGDIDLPRAALADSLYPRAPQFVEDAPDMPANQNFYIIQHGVRLSGMPSWKRVLSDEQLWQVTLFLSHMDNLPAPVAAQWKADASPSSRRIR